MMNCFEWFQELVPMLLQMEQLIFMPSLLEEFFLIKLGSSEFTTKTKVKPIAYHSNLCASGLSITHSLTFRSTPLFRCQEYSENIREILRKYSGVFQSIPEYSRNKPTEHHVSHGVSQRSFLLISTCLINRIYNKGSNL